LQQIVTLRRSTPRRVATRECGRQAEHRIKSPVAYYRAKTSLSVMRDD
jgi:hypothetical protein